MKKLSFFLLLVTVLMPLRSQAQRNPVEIGFDASLIRSVIEANVPGNAGRTSLAIPAPSVRFGIFLSDLVSLPKPVGLDGKSFMTLFHNTDTEGFNSSFSQYRSFQKNTDFTNLMSYAMHTKNYTYIEWQDLERGYKVVNRELYALTKGTIENKNISLNLEYSTKIKEFSKKINHKFKQYRSKAQKYKNQYGI